MISRGTSSVPKDDIFSKLLFSELRCSQGCRLHSQMFLGLPLSLEGVPPVHCGLLLVHPSAQLVITRFPRSLQMVRQHIQVHLNATASVQSTLGFQHHGILVQQLPNTPGGSQWQNTFCSLGRKMILTFWRGGKRLNNGYYILLLKNMQWWFKQCAKILMVGPIDGFIRVDNQTNKMHIIPIGAIIELVHLVR